MDFHEGGTGLIVAGRINWAEQHQAVCIFVCMYILTTQAFHIRRGDYGSLLRFNILLPGAGMMQ